MKWMIFAGILLALSACTTLSSTLPTGCNDTYADNDACTFEYNPVCATFLNGTNQTLGNTCIACTTDNVTAVTQGECFVNETTNNTNTSSGVDMSAVFTTCSDARPEFCTEQYDPVCARLDTGVRCITTPCPSTDYQTMGNACSACSDENVTGYLPGACETRLFVVCGETRTGFSAEEYAANTNGTCVDVCPTGFDSYVTQIGVSLCIQHYGEQEILQWPVCTASTDTCECVRTTETTSGEQISGAQYRCVPEQYSSRLLFRSGKDRLDEQGQQSVMIA